VEELCHQALPLDHSTASLPFPVRCVRELLDTRLLPATPWALEVGCSVGGAAFELARYCEQVEASDYSASFISAAEMLKRDGKLHAERAIEGTISRPFEATVPSEIDRSRVHFTVADATALPGSLGDFDIVLAANLLCRLPSPDTFLSRCKSLVKPGGQLLLATPFTWLEEYTPLENWIGGTDPNRRSEAELSLRLDSDFELHCRRDLPFLIREHERKFQLGISLGTCWIRK
jgi:putative 4-mercaptohistidine N1-methyltranferase